MSAILSKLWPGLALAIIALFAFLLLKQGCAQPVVADSTNQVMVAAKAGYDSAKRVDSPVIAVLTQKKDSLTDVVDSLSARLIITQYNLDELGDKITGTLEAGDLARVEHDTVEIVKNCDSLEVEVKADLPIIQGYTQLTDSLIRASVAQASVQDSIVAKLKSLNLVAGNTITAQQLQYAIINKDDMSKTAQLKIYRPVAIGGAALLAAIIVLKFIAH